MDDWVIAILAAGGVGVIAWLILQTRFEFEIRVEAGRAALQRGKVAKSFVDCVTDVCQECGVVRGWVGGVRRGKRISLRFSNTIPPGPQQRLRNEWNLS